MNFVLFLLFSSLVVSIRFASQNQRNLSCLRNCWALCNVNGAVRAVRFNVDGNYCLTCGSEKSLKLWNPHKGTLLKTYNGHGYEVLDAAGSFDNSQLCSCGSDKTVVLWDVARGQVIRKFRGHAGKVNCVQFSEEATVIWSGSIDSSVRCWDCRSRRPDSIQILDEAKDGISSLKVSVGGRVRRYDLRAGELYSDYIGSPITCVCFSKDGQCMLPASLDSTLHLLDKDTGEMLGEYTGHKNVAYKMDYSLSERDTHIGSCFEDGKMYFWDLVEAVCPTEESCSDVGESSQLHQCQSGPQAVKQLQAEAGLERMKVSKAASDLLQYCLEQAKNDPLLTGIPASSNPFKEKRMCTIA